MNSAQFAAASMLARLSPERTLVARAVLVDGKTYMQAVAPYGWTRQAAYLPVKKIKEQWGRYRAAQKAEASENDKAVTTNRRRADGTDN